jgi:hypothetical protein
MSFEGGQSYYRLSKEDIDKEVRNDRLRLVLQRQAQSMALFTRDEGHLQQTRRDAERYLNAIRLECDDDGKNCQPVHPSPEERRRRQKYLDDLQFQYGVRWDQYYRQRDLTDFETKYLVSQGQQLDFLKDPANHAQVLALINPRRETRIKLIRQKSNQTGILPGILIDDLSIEQAP